MAAMWEEKLEAIDTAEVHWGTSTILAVFFAASLISAVFFGLGYSFGRGGTPKAALDIPASSGSIEGPASTLNPPTPNLSARTASHNDPVPLAVGDTAAVNTHSGSDVHQPAHTTLRQVSATQSKPAAGVLIQQSKPKTVALSAGVTRYMVQVGAIGDRKDAQKLISQLRKHGFHAAIYPGKHDKFLHVQLGPFANAQQAQAVRHKVMASGYRAMLKTAS